MSLRHEQFRALHNTREFLFDLLRPDKTPRVPYGQRPDVTLVRRRPWMSVMTCAQGVPEAG